MVVTKDSSCKGILRDFSQNTNMHGVGGVGRRESSACRIVFWLFITLAGAIILGLWTKSLVDRYFAYDVTVSIDVVYKSNIEFPAVTICNLNPVREHLMEELSGDDNVAAMVKIQEDLKANYSTNPYAGVYRHDNSPDDEQPTPAPSDNSDETEKGENLVAVMSNVAKGIKEDAEQMEVAGSRSNSYGSRYGYDKRNPHKHDKGKHRMQRSNKVNDDEPFYPIRKKKEELEKRTASNDYDSSGSGSGRNDNESSGSGWNDNDSSGSGSGWYDNESSDSGWNDYDSSGSGSGWNDNKSSGSGWNDNDSSGSGSERNDNKSSGSGRNDNDSSGSGSGWNDNGSSGSGSGWNDNDSSGSGWNDNDSSGSGSGWNDNDSSGSGWNDNDSSGSGSQWTTQDPYGSGSEWTTTDPYGSGNDGSGSGWSSTDWPDHWYSGNGEDYEDYLDEKKKEFEDKVKFNESQWSSDRADKKFWDKMNTTGGIDDKQAMSFVLHKGFLENFSKASAPLQKFLGHQKDTMILSCGYKGHTCTPKSFQRFFNYKYGNCYTFNAGWGSNSSESSINTNLPGPLNGLTLELFVEEMQYVKEITENTGLKVVIHSKDRMPFPEDEGLEVPPGYQTSIGVRMKEILRKPAPYPSKCRNNSYESSILYNAYNLGEVRVKYTSQACIKTCLQMNYIKNCDCGNVQFPTKSYVFRNLTKHWGREPRVCDTSNQTQYECMTKVEKRFEQGNITCDCPQSCNDTIFGTTNSMSKWPSMEYSLTLIEQLSKRNTFWSELFQGYSAEDGARILEENVLKLAIYYEDLNYEKIEQHEAYGIVALVSDFGGQMGLWLGLSVIALFEFLELLFDLFWYWTGKNKKKREPKPNQELRQPPTISAPEQLTPENETEPGSRNISPSPEAQPRYMNWYQK